FIKNLLANIYGVMLKPIIVFIRKQIADLLDDVNESIIQKVTAVMFLFFAILMVYAVFIGLGLLGAAALVDFAHWSWFKSIIVVLPFYLLLMIITLIIGNALLHKPIIKIKQEKTDKENE
ncbi:MAG: hypothetical protein J6Y01_02805, partial [Spirochaetales bacterium]|nr:hypothetical protein [Spirochaetales bacterium]